MAPLWAFSAPGRDFHGGVANRSATHWDRDPAFHFDADPDLALKYPKFMRANPDPQH